MVSSDQMAPAVALALSFDAIYDEHLDFVWRSLRRLGVGAEGLDDAVQEVFLAVHRRLPQFQPRAKVSTWLFSICLKVASDVRRRLRRKPPGELLHTSMVDPALGPHELTAQAQALRELDAVLEELEAEKRAVFVMAEIEQMTAPEIADVLGENLNTVYSRLRAARLEFDRALTRFKARRR
jgi:RNA polymerase sigma-70 factor (ECF subfamily)